MIQHTIITHASTNSNTTSQQYGYYDLYYAYMCAYYPYAYCIHTEQQLSVCRDDTWQVTSFSNSGLYTKKFRYSTVSALQRIVRKRGTDAVTVTWCMSVKYHFTQTKIQECVLYMLRARTLASIIHTGGNYERTWQYGILVTCMHITRVE